jgi:hypothetical protein
VEKGGGVRWRNRRRAHHDLLRDPLLLYHEGGPRRTCRKLEKDALPRKELRTEQEETDKVETETPAHQTKPQPLKPK